MSQINKYDSNYYAIILIIMLYVVLYYQLLHKYFKSQIFYSSGLEPVFNIPNTGNVLLV